MTARTKIETAINLIGRASVAAPFPVGYAITDTWLAALAAGMFLEGCALEQTIVIALDAGYQYITGVVVAAGRLQATHLTTKDVFGALRAVKAQRFILARSRVAGTVAPTVPERMVAGALRAAGKRLRIPMIDHIVIGTSGPLLVAVRRWADVKVGPRA
jgi:DNA repair protein RadC